MSDIFDHAADAFDRMYNGEGEECYPQSTSWTCPTCSRLHPSWHTTCFFCKKGSGEFFTGESELLKRDL